jgi:nucleotide-binding universal stress UspA family protein
MSEAIVVGVGDSPSSEAAMRWAMHRAAALKLPVLLVHAVDDRWAYDAVGYNDWIRNSGAALLSDAKDRAAKMEPTVSLSTDLVHGAPGYSLRKKSKKASMVVIGSGHSWVGGSLTDGEHDLSTRQGVLVGADGSEESIQAVGFAAAEADRTGQELTVLHAFRLPDPWLSRGMPGGDFNGIIEEEERVVLAETVAGLADTYPDLTVHQVLQTDRSPAEALLGAAKTASLLVVGSRGRGSFKRLMLGSTAHAVLAKLPCPTIITRVKPVKHKG